MATTNEEMNKAKAEATKARAEAAKAKAEAAKIKALAAREKSRAVAGGFISFIRDKGVIGLAIGLAIGTAATGVVTEIVASVVTPTVDLVLGPKGLDGMNVTVHVADRTAVYAIGDLIDALIKFLAVAAVIYFVVMGLKLDKLDKKKDA